MMIEIIREYSCQFVAKRFFEAKVFKVIDIIFARSVCFVGAGNPYGSGTRKILVNTRYIIAEAIIDMVRDTCSLCSPNVAI